MSMVVLGGLIITATYWALQRTVVPRVQAGQPKKKKTKSHMGMGESFNFLAKSSYIRDLATLVSLLGLHALVCDPACIQSVPGKLHQTAACFLQALPFKAGNHAVPSS